MTARGFVNFKSLCAALAALLLLVSAPANAALDTCGAGGEACTIACDELGCELPLGGGDDSKSCGHCAFSHAGQSLSEPAGSAVAAQVELAGAPYLRQSRVWRTAPPRDGPEHPPKA